MIHGNKGEWSEIYTLFKLLSVCWRPELEQNSGSVLSNHYDSSSRKRREFQLRAAR